MTPNESNPIPATGKPTVSQPVKPATRPATKAQTKQEKVLALLNSPAGTTLKAIVKATGWQPHSARGFLAGVVRKKLKLNLTSKVEKDVRAYRITRRAPAKPRAAAKGR